jgi:sporulation protein YunB
MGGIFLWRRRSWRNYKSKPISTVKLNKRYKAPSLIFTFLLSMTIFVLMTIQGLWLIDKGLKPTLVRVAESQTKRIAEYVINKAVNKRIAEGLDVENLIKVQTDQNGIVSTIDFNAAIVNSVLAETSHLVQENLKQAEEGNLDMLEEAFNRDFIDENKLHNKGIIYEIPLGQATNNILLANLGPKIPVRFTVLGDILSDVKKTIQPYGINNALVEIAIEIDVSVSIIIPFATKETKVSSTIPVAMRVIQGGVPQFYNNGSNDNMPSLTIPIKPEEDDQKKSESKNKKESKSAH